MDNDTFKLIIDKLENIERIQRDGCDRLTKLEINVENHLTRSTENQVSKRQKFYFIVGLIGSYAVGTLTSFMN